MITKKIKHTLWGGCFLVFSCTVCGREYTEGFQGRCCEEGFALSHCCECKARLNSYNLGERCYPCERRFESLHSYAEHREVAAVGAERWLSGQTTKKNTRVAYVREFSKLGVVPWDASLEELLFVDASGVNTLVSELLGLDNINSKDLAFLDRNLEKLTEEEISIIETEYPETNIRLKWVHATRGTRYMRFRNNPGDVDTL